MIKKFSITAALIAAIATLFILVPSCSKEKAQNEDSIVNPADGQAPADGEEDSASETPEQPEEPVISILRVGLPEEQESSKAVLEFGYLEEFDTKVAIEQNDAGNLHTKWVEGDALRVGGKKSDDSLAESVYDIQEGFTDHIAEFAGTVPSGAVKDFYVIYPAAVSYDLIYSYDYNGVKQVGNEGTSHLNYCAMIEGFDEMPESLVLTGRYATERGLELKRSSTIKFRLKMPAEATTPTRIEFKAGKVGAQEGSDRIFYFNNTADSKISTLTLYLQDVTPVSQVLTAYMSIPWQGYSVASGQNLTISVFYTTAGDENKVVSKIFTPGAKTFGGNQTILYQLNMTTGQSVATDTGGDGSSAHPYLLSTPEDLLSMKGKLLNGQKVYFKMTADIDMADIANWSPLNDSEINGFNRYIDFDGDGHLIKNLRCTGKPYASFFGVLCGECRETGFTDAQVSADGTSAGIVAAHLGIIAPGSVDETGCINQCYTSGRVSTNSASVGGLAGQIGALSGSTKSTISNSYSSAVVEGNNCGGLTGFLREGAQIQGSYFCGVNVSPSSLWTGGIAARSYDYNYTTRPVINQCASLTKTSLAPHSGNTMVVFRICKSDGITMSGNLIGDVTNGNQRYSSDTQAAVAIGTVQTLFTTTLGSANGWSSTLDDGYPLLSWQVTRGDYATYAGHGRDYFDGGNGSESQPFLISKAYQLYNIEEQLNNSDTTYFKLTADVDLAAIDNWTPINKSNLGLLIDWDGNNKKLSNLTVTSTSGYGGLFGILLGKVSDLTLKDFTITSSGGGHCGILAGFLATVASGTYARVKNITIDGGSVSSGANGGIGSLGGNSGQFYASGCTSSATLTQNSDDTNIASYASGGLVGCNRNASGDDYKSIIENCSFSGSLTGYNATGGILGYTNASSWIQIKRCSCSGTVTSRARTTAGKTQTGECVGGIVGWLAQAESSVTECQVTQSAHITGAANKVGGIVGYCTSGSICECSTASPYVSGVDYVGGIVGEHTQGAISACTASSTSVTTGNYRVGCIVGYYNHTTSVYSFTGNNSYGSVLASWRGGGIIGSIYSSVGSQFIDCHAYYAVGSSISAKDNGGYFGGIVGHFHGTTAPAEGATFSNCSSSAYVQKTGTGSYAGGIIGYVSYDESGTAHSVLSMDRCSSSGTIYSGNTSSGGLIGGMRGKKLTMTNCHSSAAVSADVDYAGGLIAYLSGQYTSGDEADISISNCTFSGTVNAGTDRCGGLFGEVYECPGTVADCHCTRNGSSDWDICGVNWVGGLAGNITSGSTLTFTDCYSTCAVKGRYYVGGLIGRSESSSLSISNCYHTNAAVSYDSSYASYAENEICAIGGLIGGIVGSADISQCFVKNCNVTGTYAIGGLVGYFGPDDSSTPTLTISESYYHGGTVSAEGIGNIRATGGILGKNYAYADAYDKTVIKDCYSRGTVTTANGQVVGGIVGEAMPGITVEYCISDCSVSAPRSPGGIIGRACRGTGSYDSDSKVKIENCICWSSSIAATDTYNSDSWGAGAIIGVTSKLTWMYRCYYNPNMNFQGVNDANVLIEQNPGKGYNTEYAGSTASMVFGNTPGTSITGSYTHVIPYHGGTVQSSGRSACTVAQAIGFATRKNASDQYIWKIFYGGLYSEDHLMPELRNNRETDAEGNGEGIEDFPTNDIIDDGGNF